MSNIGASIRRPLSILFLCLSLALVITPPALSQGNYDTELPFEEAPAREWATLDVTAEVQDSLTDDIGRETSIPVTLINNGNIPAAGVVAAVEGGSTLAGKPIAVGDLPPGTPISVDLPFDILGRSAYPIPFSIRVTAENVPYPTVVGVEQTFAELNPDDYVDAALDADVLLEQSYDRYDGGFARPQPLLWFEWREKAAETVQVVDLKPLLTGEPPKDLILSILYYADEKEMPIPVETKYDPDNLSLTFAPPGEGRYLIEWSRPVPKDDSAEETGLEGIEAVTVTEPELPQGWTPSYHAPLVSEFNGSVSLSYPILTPPGAAGLQPNLGLSYSSANGNGMIGRPQADEVGLGWNNTALIDVTQALMTCHGDDVCESDESDADGNPNTHDPYNQYTLSYNGVGYELIHVNGKADNGRPGRYHAQGHAGLYVELCKAPFSAYCALSGTNIDTQSDVFWRIKSADNTTYRLGYTTNSEQELIYPARTVNVDNPALRWRVDTVTDRFGNGMSYSYYEDYYSGWVHPEYFHAPAGYPNQISYDAYTVTFGYQNLSNEVYRAQGYGYVVGWHTRYLTGIAIKAGTQAIRRYALGQDFQRYGTDNDTDNPPLEPPIPNQSAWCAGFDWVLTFNDLNDKDDNIKYTPDKLPTLRTIHEFGSDDNTPRSTQPDAAFTYAFLGTGEYDHVNAGRHVRYCFPYLDSMETLYGPADAATPTTAYTWRATQQIYQAAGSLPNRVVGRYANPVERETTWSGFDVDVPARNVYFYYANADMDGDKDTFQGFRNVSRCREAACTGAWAAQEALTFETRPFAAEDAALTGRMREHKLYAQDGGLVARTENTWIMLNADGISGPDPSRLAVLDKQVRRDYRGATISARTDYEYDVYGNTTGTREYGERTGTNPWRTLERVYTVNTDVGNDKWLVNLAWRETLWDGPSNGAANKIVRRTRYRYDGATCGSPDATPTNGLLTAEDAYVPGYGVSCSGTDYNTTEYTYGGSRPWQVTRVTDPAGRYKDYSWTDATRLGSVTDFVGTTGYTYNSPPVDKGFRWQVKEVAAPNGARTGYTYDIHGRLDTVKAPNLTNGAAEVVVKDYNYHDQHNPFLVEEIVPVMSANNTRTFYDAVGRPLQTRQYFVSGDFNTIVTDTEYDAFGRVRCATAALHSTQKANFETTLDCDAQPKTVYTYDVTGEQLTVTGVNGAVTTTAVQGRTRDVTDGNGRHFVYQNDELGRLIKVTQPVVNGQTPVMTYTYDLADNLLTATGPNNVVTTMTYDRLGRKLTMNDPDMGQWSYAYDGSGNLARQTDAKNQRLCFYFDAANRLTSKRHDGTGVNNCPATPGGTELAGYGYYVTGSGKGLLATVAGGGGVGGLGDTFMYDLRGRTTTHTRVIGGSAGQTTVMSMTYDDADRPLTVTITPEDSSAHTATYTYDGEFAGTLSVTGFGQLVNDVDYNHRRQLTSIERAGPDTTLTYYGEAEAFRLDEIQHGTTGDAIPDFLYNQYDNLGNLEIVQMRQSGATETQTFGYDAVSRLTSAVGTGAAAYDYAYTYGPGGNLATRVNRTPNPDLTRSYVYDIDDTPNDGRHYHALESISGDGMTAAFVNDANGNMTTRTVNGQAYTQEFDIDNRLTKVIKEAGANDLSAWFYYDADGNRILTIYKNGTAETGRVYTPFPEFEESVPPSGSTTQRSSYFLAGQLIAARVRTGTTGNGTLYFAYADQLGNVSAWTNASGALVSGSLARYEPFGGYRTKPASTVNPDISDRGFTGHRMNNSATNDLGLIYMNARYYLPEIGRFISADTIVPEPKDPQTYNRYSYALNSPVNFIDPTGHCTSNYETGSQDMATCLSAWNSVANYLYGAAFGPGGSGHFPNETVSDWLANADIGTLENLMESYGIDYGYVYTPPQRYSMPTARRSGARQEMCQYWQSCYAPPAEYSSIGGNIFVGPRIIWDRWDNVYLYFHLSSSPGVSVTAGNIRVHDSGGTKEIESLAVDEQETAVEAFLTGASDGGCISIGVAGCVAGNSTRSYAVEGGFAFPPGLGTDVGYGIMLYNANSHTPWFWQQWFK